MVEIAVKLDISKNTVKALCDREPEFLTTIKKCKILCENWWEAQGRVHLVKEKGGAEFNHVLWYMNMKNRFGWADKTEAKTENTSTLNISISKDAADDIKDILGDE